VGLTSHQDRQGADETARAVQERGQRSSVEPFDASAPEAGDVVDRLADHLGGIGVLVNVAGTGHRGLVLDLQGDMAPHPGHRPRRTVPVLARRHVNEVASVIGFLASPRSSYVTGSTYVGDGGLTLMAAHGHDEADQDWRRP
jgi:NAD(P)-dependent dehydrogenase (short-subunit alcohol dehydrogenase family)